MVARAFPDAGMEVYPVFIYFGKQTPNSAFAHASFLHLLSSAVNSKPYGRYESEKQPEEKSSTKRKESQQPEETCCDVLSSSRKEKIVSSFSHSSFPSCTWERTNPGS